MSVRGDVVGGDGRAADGDGVGFGGEAGASDGEGAADAGGVGAEAGDARGGVGVVAVALRVAGHEEQEER